MENNICSAKYNFRKNFDKRHRVYYKHRKTTLISTKFCHLTLLEKKQTFVQNLGQNTVLNRGENIVKMVTEMFKKIKSI